MRRWPAINLSIYVVVIVHRYVAYVVLDELTLLEEVNSRLRELSIKNSRRL